MSPRKYQTFDIPSTQNEFSSDIDNHVIIRRKSMPADMHHPPQSSQPNMVGTDASPLSKMVDNPVNAPPDMGPTPPDKQLELFRNLHIDEEEDEISVEIPVDIPPVVADPRVPRLVTPASILQPAYSQQQQYPSPSETESPINHQRLQGHAPYYPTVPNAASHHINLQQQQQHHSNISLASNQFPPISPPANANHRQPVQGQTTLNVKRAQLPPTAIPSSRSSPTPPHMRTLRSQPPTTDHIMQFSLGSATPKQHKGSHTIGGGNNSQRR